VRSWSGARPAKPRRASTNAQAGGPPATCSNPWGCRIAICHATS